MTGLAVYITCPPVWQRSLGEARQGLSACSIWSDWSRESPSRLSLLEGLEKDVSGIWPFSCDPHTDGSFPSRLRNSTRHGSCKMPSKYGLSRFHASPSVLLLILTLLKQAEFCSSTRNIQKQPVRQSNNQSQDDSLRAPRTISVKTCAVSNRAREVFPMNPRTKTAATPSKSSYGPAQKDNIDLLS